MGTEPMTVFASQTASQSAPQPALPAGWPAMSLAAAHALMTQPGSPFEMQEIAIRGVPTRVWKNALPTLRDVFVSGRRHGDSTFLVYEDERASFEAFSRATLHLAQALAGHGVVKGDRVAIVMRNLPEWPVAFFAAALVGAIATPLNAWWSGAELEYGLTDSGAKVAIVDGERLARLADHLASCRDLVAVYVTRATEPVADPRIRALEDLLGPVESWGNLPDKPVPDVALAPDDLASILYTSGTTGKPKGALGTHRNATSTIVAQSFTAARNFVRRGEPVPQPDPAAPQRASLIGIPLFHTTASHAGLCPALHNGGKLVFMRRWDAERGMQLIARERCTHAGGVPTIAWQLLEHPARAKYDLSSLESITYGGAPAAPELMRRIKQVFPKCAAGLGWGMTETTATFTGHSGEDYENRPESSGPALPVCDMQVVDEQGAALAPGSVGELWVKGPNVVVGYWNKPEATAETFVDGWLKTGDLAWIDTEGFCFIADRKKDMLIRGGENIYCIEVEDALYRHPAVMDAAVVGRPHLTLGEEPAAVVTLKPGATASEPELRGFVAQQLAAFKVPVSIAFHDGMLPRNPNGKIMKAALRKLFADPA